MSEGKCGRCGHRNSHAGIPATTTRCNTVLANYFLTYPCPCPSFVPSVGNAEEGT